MDKELLYKFFEGAASEEEGMKIKVWIEASEENKRIFFKERRLFDAILLHGDLVESEIKIPFRKKIFRMEWLKIAGIVLITLAISYIYQQYKAYYAPLVMNTISVPAGQRANITLPDGTNVWLNARSTIKYPTSFNDRKRTIYLEGEAYFDVTKNKEKPFVVQTEKYDVEVLGTKFNVEAYPGQTEFETALMQGKVEVTSRLIPDQKIILAPDQKAFLKDGKLQVSEVEDVNRYRWKEGLICFKNKSILNIMKEFEKYYGIKIVINNKNILKYLYTGKFRQSDGVDYALRVLQNDIYFKYEKDNEKEVIYIN
ncbi:FecR family protein [Bacteroides sedimenti]|uniref:Anti-sigma factor n=1 Tax=Bacteroides sedimenti TaxID=2136147 RepID=A0ABM8IHZ2_9BACE